MTSRNAIISIVLVTNAFVWYFFVSEILKDIVGTSQIDQTMALLIWASHFVAIAVSVLVGASLTKRKKDRTNFLCLWMVLGTIASFASMALDLAFPPNIVMISIILGVTFGIGMPCCIGYFAESVDIGNRGRFGGLILFLSGVGMVLLGIIAGDSIGNQIFTLSLWRAFGLVSFALFSYLGKSAKLSSVSSGKSISYRSLLHQRPFILYLVPWVMFSLITYLTTPLQLNIQNEIFGKNTIGFLTSIGNIVLAVSAAIAGFMSDIVGRKRMAIVGFVLLGLGYSVLGIYPMELLSWYFRTTVDAIAWGILLVLFVATLWGDISQDAPSDKHYAIGVLPFFISKFLQLIAGSEITAAIPATSIFSFTAFFLFLAVLPLVYAPETLPEKLVKERELKTYLEKAQQIAAKNQKKKEGSKECENKDEDETVEFQVIQEDDEKARELAEKYY